MICKITIGKSVLLLTRFCRGTLELLQILFNKPKDNTFIVSDKNDEKAVLKLLRINTQSLPYANEFFLLFICVVKKEKDIIF